jgi:hypothetical protein
MSTSIPSTCGVGQQQKKKKQQPKLLVRQVSKELQNSQPFKDPLMFVLYSGHAASLLVTLILESKRNIASDFATSGVRNALGCFAVSAGGTAISTLRVIFFLLLSKDAIMRRKLCEVQITWFLPMLCPHKACGLYESLEGSVIPKWIRNEAVTILDFEETLRDLYLNS